MRQVIRLIPFLFFKLGLFSVWRLIPGRYDKRSSDGSFPSSPTATMCLAVPRSPCWCRLPAQHHEFGLERAPDFRHRAVRRSEVYGFDVAGAFAAGHLPARDRPAVPPRGVAEGEATLIVCVNPDGFRYVASFLPPAIFENKYVIGCCVWELERIPDQWLEPLAMLDEIWVTSEFVRRAFVESGVSLPCRIVPPQLVSAAPVSPDRARFGIPPNTFAVLLAFGLASSIVRKNPMAAVRAFLKAFPNESDVRLVFKISDIDIEPAAWKNFRAEVGDDCGLCLSPIFSQISKCGPCTPASMSSFRRIGLKGTA